MDVVDAVGRLGGREVARWVTRRSPRVLMYHRFGPADTAETVGAETFDRQMRLVRERCAVVGMTRLGRLLLAGEPVPDHAVVVTVDDGYRDFYTFAFPVLRRHGIPATLYVPSEFPDGSLWLWPDRLRFILARTERTRLGWGEGGGRVEYDLTRASGRRAAWNALGDFCLERDLEERESFLAGLARDLGVTVPDRPTAAFEAASWEELREMQRDGIEIGSHSATHPRLVGTPPARLDHEIAGSRRRLEARLSAPVTSFCYPQGRAVDYDEGIKAAVMRAGYETAVVAFAGPRPVADRFEIRRYSVSADMRQFRNVLSGFRLLGNALGGLAGALRRGPAAPPARGGEARGAA